MPWITTFEENEARGILRWVYRVARWRQGRVPNIVKASSLNPGVLVALGPLYRAVMEGKSPLTRAQRKMIAIVASRVNNCFYLTESNGEFLREELNDADLADALMTDYRTAPIDPEFKELLCFTEKIARDAGQITADDVARLRGAGFSDRAVLDTAHVAGFFSYMNRVVQALGADGKADITTPLKIKNWLDASSEAHT
jgi:uncharacterized peroxidase-related enzyme